MLLSLVAASWFWPASVCAAMALGWLIVRMRRAATVRARRAVVERERERLRCDKPALDRVVAFDGVLEGSVVTRVPRGGEDAAAILLDAETTPDVVWLKTNGKTILLRGPLQVRVGTRESRFEGEVVRTVERGDLVTAFGLYTRMGEDATSYRAHAGHLALVPYGDDRWPLRPVTLASRARPVVRMGVGPYLRACGLSALVVTSVAWGTHERVVQALTWKPAATVECRRELDDAFRAGRGGIAAARAAVCGSALEQARARWIQADFSGAADAFAAARRQAPSSPVSLSEIEAYVLADRVDKAALGLGDAARRPCNTSYAGELTWLQNHLPLTLRGEPRVVRAAARRADGYATLLYEAFLDGKLAADGVAPTIDYRYETRWVKEFPFALEAAALVAPSERPAEIMTTYAVRLALLHTYLGEREAALQFIGGQAQGLAALSGSVDPQKTELFEAMRRDTLVGAAIASFEAGSVDGARRYLAMERHLKEDRFYGKSGEQTLDDDLALEAAPSPERLRTMGAGTFLAPLFEAAATGGGAALLAARGDRDLFFVLPRAARTIRSGHEVLVRWVERDYPEIAWTNGLDPLVQNVARRRQAARALGLVDLERELGEVARRLLAAKLDAHALTIFALEELVSC